MTFQGYATPDHHCPTPKPVMLDDVPGSIMFTTASADSYMPITCAQCDPALTCVENELTVADLMILVFPRDCQSTCTVLGWEHRSHERTSELHASHMKSLYDSVVRDMPTSSLREVIL